MKLAKLILAAIWSGAYGVSISQLFHQHIGVGLGIFVIGTWFLVWYILLWMIDIGSSN